MNTNLVIATAAAGLLAACSPNPQGAATASAQLSPASGSKVQGRIQFTQAGPNRVRVSGEVTGHQPGMKGFHIHEKGDCSAPDATSAGGHFNPHAMKHGASPTSGHAGDMGNINVGADGRATIDTTFEGLTLDKNAPNSILGKAVVVHAGTDDQKTDPTGNAGGRVACGVIG
ncbi:MAG TPA: superoxide dismutase family protein [Burkholderiales bacterium]|nr:superoxide dismutase family protein [Burkholderiales bacterium]